jgi:hypothetical protein
MQPLGASGEFSPTKSRMSDSDYERKQMGERGIGDFETEGTGHRQIFKRSMVDLKILTIGPAVPTKRKRACQVQESSTGHGAASPLEESLRREEERGTALPHYRTTALPHNSTTAEPKNLRT